MAMMSACGYRSAILKGKDASPYRWSPPSSHVIATHCGNKFQNDKLMKLWWGIMLNAKIISQLVRYQNQLRKKSVFWWANYFKPGSIELLMSYELLFINNSLTDLWHLKFRCKKFKIKVMTDSKSNTAWSPSSMPGPKCRNGTLIKET